MAQTHFCVNNTWRILSENEYDTGRGCTWKGHCKGSATWLYYDGNQYQQYFCTEEQHEEAENMPQPFDYQTLADEKIHADWAEVLNGTACWADGDCDQIFGKRFCRDYYYESDDTGNSFDRGKICVGDWIKSSCCRKLIDPEDPNEKCVPRDEFQLFSGNYTDIEFEYSYSQICEKADQKNAIALVATLLTSLAAFAQLL